MLLSLIATTAAFTLSVGLKTLQARTIALKNYKIIPLVSYLIAVLELTVFTTVIGTALVSNSVWPVFVIATGAAAGSLAGVYIADLIHKKSEDV